MAKFKQPKHATPTDHSTNQIATVADAPNATSGILDEWTDFAEQRAWFLFEAAQEG